MKAIKKSLLLIAVLCATIMAYTQPPDDPDGFIEPRIDYFWIAIGESEMLPPPLSAGIYNDPGETGTWLPYVTPDGQSWYNIWFYNDPLDMSRMKKIRMGFWIQLYDPLLPPGQTGPGDLYYVVNWSTPDWEGPGYPLPPMEAHIERSPTMGPIPVFPGPAQWIELYWEIPYYNPEWVSVDIFGYNIWIISEMMMPPVNSSLYPWWLSSPGPGGIIVHECLAAENGTGLDFGDAPEGDTAYINPVVLGNFPTCLQVGPVNSFISHGCQNPLFFGGLIDCELDGNAGYCPTFGPNWYNMDECGTFPYPFPPGTVDWPIVDEGLFLPVPNTLGLLQPSFYGYFICGAQDRQALDTVCKLAQWGQDIDIWIDSRQEADTGIFNILFDWNQDGDWIDIVQCGVNPVSEHALINWRIPPGFWGPASALPVPPPPIQVGPKGGYVWARFTLSEQIVPDLWDGSGVFEKGETEDYLLYIAPIKAIIPVSDWALFLAIGLIMLFTLLLWWRKN